MIMSSWWTSAPAVSFVAGLGLGVAIGFAGFWVRNRQDNYLSDDEDDEDDEDWTSDESDGEETAIRGPLKMILVVRTDLKMGKGKIAAQCSHAAVAAFKSARSKAPAHLKAWTRSGQAKVAVKVDSEEELVRIHNLARAQGLVAQLIQDAGRTQIAAGSKTVVAIGPAEEHRIDKVTGTLKLL